MPKTLEELQQQYRDQMEKVYAGEERLMKAFIIGTTVEHPLKNNQKITFRTIQEEQHFLRDELSATGEFALNEMGRTGCGVNHMMFYLYSKGFTPKEVADYMVADPEKDAELINNMEERIRAIRQEYYDQVIHKDTDRIADMYVNALKNLGDQKMDWLSKGGTPEGYIEIQPMLAAYNGGHSLLSQTLHNGSGYNSSEAELAQKILKRMEDEEIEYEQISDAMLTLQAIAEGAHNAYDRLAISAVTRDMLAMTIQFCGSVPEGTTIRDLGVSGGMSMKDRFFYNAQDVSNNYHMQNKEFAVNTNAWFRGEQGAVAPLQILDTKDESEEKRRVHCGILPKLKNGKLDPDDVRRKEWQPAMEAYFRGGVLLDPGSVIHCYNMAKDGTLDAATGVVGDGQRLLQVIDGNLKEYDKLSDLAKGAAAGHLAMKYPGLFFGSVQQMLRSAKQAKMDLDNPVYVSAMEGISFYSKEETLEKLSELTETLAREKLDRSLETVPAENKRELARTLFLMQLGDAERENSANRKNAQPEMLTVLAAGGNVEFSLPQMSSGEKKTLRQAMPEGRVQTAPGIHRNVRYDDDGTLNVRMYGARGHADAQAGMRVDLRGIDPAHLNLMLAALDEKMNSMSGQQLDDMIGKLGGRRLGGFEMSKMVRSIGKDIQGDDPRKYDALRLAAKEIDPDPALDMNDLFALERCYSMPPEGERKYTAPKPLSTKECEKALQQDPLPGRKQYFEQFISCYNEQARQMQMYAETAERMHRARVANENSAQPLDNVRIFTRQKERELADKYRAAKEMVGKMRRGIELYRVSAPNSAAEDLGLAWKYACLATPGLSKEVKIKAGKKGPSVEELETSLQFRAVDFEESTFREQQNLAGNKWRLLGVKYSNSGKYQDILDSMERLKKMRELGATKENILAYQKEYEYLRDLCEDYIVTRRNPWTTDGKERKRMVTDVWEGMSNVNSASFRNALASADPGKKLSEINIHAGYRRTISLEELQKREPERTARLTSEKARRKEAAEKAAHQREEKTRQTEHGKSLQDRINLS
ncbi:MAG: hypothetical protein J5969_07760 [Lachnospiraceae bacterium]|nr:hypothetical protein [Lachnospiraceae bacterium]